MDYSGIDVDVAFEIGWQLRLIAAEHPVVRRVVRGVRASRAMVPGMPMGHNDGEIFLNARDLSFAADAVRRRLEQTVRGGAHPPGCGSLAAGVSHEVGEAMEVYIASGRAGAAPRSLLSQWKLRMPYAGLGRYAKHRHDVHGQDERFPEAFMALLHTPRDVASPALSAAIDGIAAILGEVEGW